MTCVITISGGKGSAVAGKLHVEDHGCIPVLLFADTKGEHPDLWRFLGESAEWIGGDLTILRDGRDIWQVFRDSRMIGNTRLSVCSRVLKQEPTAAWLQEHTDPASTPVVLGIGSFESHRVAAIERNYLPWRASFPLIEHGTTAAEVDAMLAAAGIEQPDLYRAGFAHNNCAGACVRAGQGQWVQLLEYDPARYAHEEAQEQSLREYLGKDVAILRDRRGGTTKPLTLRALRERHTADPDAVDRHDIGGCGCTTDLTSMEG